MALALQPAFDWLQGLFAPAAITIIAGAFCYHTFSNGDPPKPYGEGINFVGGFLGFAASFHPDVAKGRESAPNNRDRFISSPRFRSMRRN